MMAGRNLQHSAISLLSLPDELFEISLTEALLGPVDFSLASRTRSSVWENQRFANDVHYLLRICNCVRHILLPELYRFVILLRPNNKRRLSFLELMPICGHICQKLAFRIPGRGASFCKLVELLRLQCKHLTNLQVLELDIRLDDDADSSDTRYQSSYISMTPSNMKMGPRERYSVGKTCVSHCRGFLSCSFVGFCG